MHDWIQFDERIFLFKIFIIYSLTFILTSTLFWNDFSWLFYLPGWTWVFFWHHEVLDARQATFDTLVQYSDIKNCKKHNNSDSFRKYHNTFQFPNMTIRHDLCRIIQKIFLSLTLPNPSPYSIYFPHFNKNVNLK